MVNIYLLICKIPVKKILKSVRQSQSLAPSFFYLLGSSQGTLTGNFLPPLEAEAHLTGTSVFLCAATPLTISAWLLFDKLLPGLAWEAFAGICWGVTDVCVAVCVLFTGGAFGSTGFSPSSHVILVWTAQGTVLDRNRRKKRFAPAINQEFVSRTYLPAQDRTFFISIFTLWISFSVFHTLHSLEDDGCAPSQFMHLRGWCRPFMLQGTFRAHCCQNASPGHMFKLLAFLKQHNKEGTKGSTITSKYPMRICFGRMEQQKVKNKVLVSFSLYLSLTHFIPQMRISRFHHDVISARLWETFVLDQYFHFCVQSVGVTDPS